MKRVTVVLAMHDGVTAHEVWRLVMTRAMTKHPQFIIRQEIEEMEAEEALEEQTAADLEVMANCPDKLARTVDRLESEVKLGKALLAAIRRDYDPD